jgi:uncharacterized damage-inducible protein DinB
MTHEPAHFFALATELEKEGQYNGAKLLRAAAQALVLRESRSVRVALDVDAQADQLEQLAGELDTGPAATLAGPLLATARALRASTVPLYAEAPDPHVCRICGAVSLQPFPERCPDCGRWPDTAERFRPIYWQRASTPPEAIALLARTPDVIAEILRGALTDVPGPDGGWTAHQTLEHLHNAQSIFRGRIDQLLAGGEPELASVMVWRMEGNAVTTFELLEGYRTLRQEIVDLLTSAPVDAWWNAGHHEEFGRVTLAEQASYFANHEPTHLAQLADAATSGDPAR